MPHICVVDIIKCVFIPLKLFSIKWISLQSSPSRLPQLPAARNLFEFGPLRRTKDRSCSRFGRGSQPRVGSGGKRGHFPPYGRWGFQPHVGAPNCAVGPSIKASLESANNPRGFIQVKCTKPRCTMPAKLSFRASSCSYRPWKKFKTCSIPQLFPLQVYSLRSRPQLLHPLPWVSSLEAS